MKQYHFDLFTTLATNVFGEDIIAIVDARGKRLIEINGGSDVFNLFSYLCDLHNAARQREIDAKTEPF